MHALEITFNIKANKYSYLVYKFTAYAKRKGYKITKMYHFVACSKHSNVTFNVKYCEI